MAVVPKTAEEFEAAERRVGDNARAVLAALRDLGVASTCREVTKRVVDRGEWSSPGHPTKGNTPAQRGEPYEGIVYQHLRNFVARGLMTEHPPPAPRKRPKLYAAIAVPAKVNATGELIKDPPTLRKRAADVLALKAAEPDLSFKEIGERLGISTSYAHELHADPYGEARAARKKKRECETEGCGRQTHGHRRCNGCRHEIEDLMPSCRVERWARAIAREQRITINFLLVEDEKGGFARVVEVETPRGKVERRLRKADSWADGMGACGIDVDLVR